MMCGGLENTRRSCRRLRSFGGLEVAEDQKIAAFGSSYTNRIPRDFSSPAKQELP
jgi:hypothetical protein